MCRLRRHSRSSAIAALDMCERGAETIVVGTRSCRSKCSDGHALARMVNLNGRRGSVRSRHISRFHKRSIGLRTPSPPRFNMCVQIIVVLTSRWPNRLQPLWFARFGISLRRIFLKMGTTSAPSRAGYGWATDPYTAEIADLRDRADFGDSVLRRIAKMTPVQRRQFDAFLKETGPAGRRP
jgi:hypothetical protein